MTNITNTTNLEEASMEKLAHAIRALSMDAVQRANSGHPGMPMGAADIATVLFTKFLKHDPAHPDWPDRDRFILSAGHGSMLLYSLLYLCGYPDIDIDEIRAFRQLGSRTPGHPEYGVAAGIETTTGPLGQGLATAVGMALAERMLATRFGSDLVDHKTYVLVGDGDLMEGISQEAISLAGHLRLKKLIVLYDSNGISIDGATSLTFADDTLKRAEASGWDSFCVDGHNQEEIEQAIRSAIESDSPSLIMCQTKIGFGSPNKEGSESSHGAPLGEQEIKDTRQCLNWESAAFVIPSEILSNWREAGSSKAHLYKSWTETLASKDLQCRSEFKRISNGKLPEGWSKSLINLKRSFADDNVKLASRVASQKVLEKLSQSLPELVGGSADLSGSNGTRTQFMEAINPNNFGGNYIHYGVREHGMAAAMNGIALHGGFIPYGGTFLIFSDYCKPAIRLSALMNQRVIYVMTHDSIGLGEDGPTHQPVEHLASLRAIPNLRLYRPADSVETIECWQLAIEFDKGPSVLALSRQGLQTQRQEPSEINLCSRGGYILNEARNGKPKIVILATGSEISIAQEAKTDLEGKGHPTRVVSLPCWELFDLQTPTYQEEVLTTEAVRIGIEAAVCFGWERYLGKEGVMVGMKEFGASAPADKLFSHFQITKEAVIEAALSKLS